MHKGITKKSVKLAILPIKYIKRRQLNVEPTFNQQANRYIDQKITPSEVKKLLKPHKITTLDLGSKIN